MVVQYVSLMTGVWVLLMCQVWRSVEKCYEM